MAGLFRLTSLIEGVTTLFLFLVAMPMKYLAGSVLLMPLAGWAHGVAFLAYLLLMVATFSLHRVGPAGWLRSLVAALFPFGTFLNDAWLRRTLGLRQAAA